MAHPECLPEVLALADAIASTSGMLAYARQGQANQFIVGTEMGLIHRLNQENPDNQFYSPTEYLICPTMNRIAKPDALISVYPTHIETEKLKSEIENANFSIKNKFSGTLVLHGKLEEGQLLNFGKGQR
jgi:quinolinate synthase